MSLASILGRKAGASPLTEEEIRRMAAAAFHESGGLWVCLRRDWLRNDMDREYLLAMGRDAFGRAR